MIKPKLLITGINGLIGRVLRDPLGKSFEVYGLDLTPPFPDRVFQADIADARQVSRVLDRLGPVQFVIHLAAHAAVDTAWEPVLRVNIQGTRNLYEAARVSGVKRVVFASSNHVTGAYEGFAPHLHLHREAEPVPISVNHPMRPDSDYGVSKAFGEILARYYCARWGMESICLRIGSVCGDDDPTTDPRFLRTWLSHRDLVHLVECSLSANVAYGVYYGVSTTREPSGIFPMPALSWVMTHGTTPRGAFPDRRVTPLLRGLRRSRAAEGG